HPLRSVGLGASPFSPGRAAADRVHRFRPADRVDSGGDRRRVAAAAGGPGTHRIRMVAPLSYLDLAHRRAHRGARALEDWPDGVYWVRLPVARPLPARQSGRSCRAAGARASLLDRRLSQAQAHCDAGARCGLPGASELSLLALTYWYSASISDGSSRSSNPFIRLSGAAEESEEPFRTITWNESAVMPPSALREYVRSGAAMVPSASSPWQREQYTWKYFQPL